MLVRNVISICGYTESRELSGILYISDTGIIHLGLIETEDLSSLSSRRDYCRSGAPIRPAGAKRRSTYRRLFSERARRGIVARDDGEDRPHDSQQWTGSTRRCC